MSEERTITVVVRLNVELTVSARLTGAADDRVAEVTSVQRVVPPSADAVNAALVEDYDEADAAVEALRAKGLD